MGDIRFDGRVAIVTGAGGGLGREHALLLASRGAKVVINDLGGGTDGTGASAGPAERTAKEIEDLGGVAVADASSVATVEGGQAIVDTALDAFGGVDVVISNAGILRDKAFHNLTPELLDTVLDVHLKGAFHVLRPAWVRMREAGYGRVLVTASNAGILGNFGQSNYGAAKMGLVGLARVLAQEGARYNIKVYVKLSMSDNRRSGVEHGHRVRPSLHPRPKPPTPDRRAGAGRVLADRRGEGLRRGQEAARPRRSSSAAWSRGHAHCLEAGQAGEIGL
jgi:NAD(P)-dependent dehydrogenase (short-subunit alcohol dehydrogenase family)